MTSSRNQPHAPAPGRPFTGPVHHLGPAGTFTEHAALALAPGAMLRPETNHRAVLKAVDDDAHRRGVIAIENSREGLVPGSLIDLIHETQSCLIRAEHLLGVQFALLRRRGDKAPLTGVTAHGMALGQCTQFIAEQRLLTKSATSNAAACASIATDEANGWGALGPATAAERYGLEVQVESVGDDPNAVTRFVLLGQTCLPPTGCDRTALAVEPSVTEVGSLVRVIQEFNLRGINMKSIKSIPSRGLLDTDLFFLECPGHISDGPVRDAVRAIMSQGVPVRFLGSFAEDAKRPRTDGGAPMAAELPELERVLTRIEM